MPSTCCQMEDNTFGEAEAKANLKDYRRRGPANQTKLMLEAIRSLRLKDTELLDVGGGIGAIHHELLKDVARQATHVDASSAYLKIDGLDTCTWRKCGCTPLHEHSGLLDHRSPDEFDSARWLVPLSIIFSTADFAPGSPGRHHRTSPAPFLQDHTSPSRARPA